MQLLQAQKAARHVAERAEGGGRRAEGGGRRAVGGGRCSMLRPTCMCFATSLQHSCKEDPLCSTSFKADSQNTISCSQFLSNSLICKLSLWFQHNSTKESYLTQIASGE